MYRERKEKLGILNYLIYALIILIVLIIIIVIIVKANSHKKVEKKPVELELYSEEQLENMETDHGEIAALNMANFKFAAIDYYADRLGNEKVDMTLTLQDLYDKHLLDALEVDGAKCDAENSNVEVFKKSKEYRLEFTLVCVDTTKLTTYVGKYDYCKNSDTCEKKVEKRKENSKKEETSNPTPTTQETQETQKTKVEPTSGKYMFYEYVLTPSSKIGKYSKWSNWDTKEVVKDIYKELETKEETETKTEGCNETKEEQYISGYNTETYISGYTAKKYQIGTKKVQIGTRQKKVNGKVVNEPIYKDQPIYTTKEEPVYATKKTPIYSTRTVKVDNCQSVKKYYRYRTFSYNKGINYIKYSVSSDDENLLNKGYTKTGNTKEF